MKKYLIFSAFITGIVSCAYGMDESKKPETQTKLADTMTQVKSWHDVVPFIGKVVAYKTKPSQLSENSKNAYFLGDDSSLVYGYVYKDHIERFRWGGQKNEKGVWVIRLSKCAYDWKDACRFYEDDLEKDAAHMRCVTSQEMDKITHAVKSQKAKFEWGFLLAQELNKAFQDLLILSF